MSVDVRTLLEGLTWKVVPLVDTPIKVKVRTLQGRQLLEAGLSPLINMGPGEEMTEEEADATWRAIKRVVMVGAVSPRVIESDNPGDGEVSLEELSDADLMLLFRNIVTMSDSRFYGVNRGAYDPMENLELLDSQLETCFVVDRIASRWGGTAVVSDLPMMRWSNEELALANAIIEGADEYRRIKAADTSRPEGREAR